MKLFLTQSTTDGINIVANGLSFDDKSQYYCSWNGT